MITIRECTRPTTCYDCDNRECTGHGDKGADCPKYHCDNPNGLQSCDNCSFIDGFIEEMRTKMKKIKFGKIRIYFRDGKVDTIPRKLWDDYEYNGALFVVKRCGAWIATYNIGDTTAIIVDTKIRKKKK